MPCADLGHRLSPFLLFSRLAPTLRRWSPRGPFKSALRLQGSGYRLQLGLLLAALLFSPATAAEVLVGEARVQVDAPDQNAALFLWLPGCQGWPALRKETARPFATKPREEQAVCLENEFLRARFLPGFGARIYDLTWKKDGTSPLLCKDPVLFQAMSRDEGHGYMVHFGSVKWGFPFFGHAPLDHAPWKYEVQRGERGSAAFHAWVVDEETTGLRLDLTVTLTPGSTALDIEFQISNPTARTQSWDLWNDLYVPATKHTEMALPTDRVITHQEAWHRDRNMVIPWPLEDHRDLRFLRSWWESNGVFPLSFSDAFSGFYCHDRQQGLFRTFESGKGIGTKFWMPALSWRSDLGEMFVGSNLTHDERRILEPGKRFGWKERWIPFRDLKGVDCGNGDLVLHLEADPQGARVYLTAPVPLEKVELGLEVTPPGNGRTESWGSWSGALAPGEASLATFKPFPAETGFVACKVRYGDRSYAWTIGGEEVKKPYQHEELEKARLEYSQSLRTEKASAPGKSTPKPRDESGPALAAAKRLGLPVQPLWKRERKLGVDAARRLYRPNAVAALQDGTFVVADSNTLLHFDAKFKWLGKWGGPEELFCPLGLAVDGTGRLLVADTGNQRILRLDLAASPWKVERTWSLPDRCAEVVWHAGRIVYSAPLQHRVMGFPDTAPGGEVRPEALTSARLQTPFGLAFQGEDCLVADPLQGQVLRIQPDGSCVVVAGEAEGLSKPSRLLFLKDGLLISDAGRSRIYRLAGGKMEVLVEGNLLGELSLAIPGGLAAAGERILLSVADPARLALLDGQGKLQADYQINNNGGLSGYRPNSMAVLPDKRVVTVDDTGGRLRVFDASGRQIRVAGSWGREDGQLWEPSVVRADSKGNLYLSDLLNYRILRFDSELRPAGAVELDSVRTEGLLKTSFWYAFGLAIGPGDRLYVSDHAHRCIRIYSPAPENKPLEVIECGRDFHPLGLDVDPEGVVLVANSLRAEVGHYNPRFAKFGVSTLTLGQGVIQPHCVAWDGEGGYWISGRGYGCELWHFDLRGRLDRAYEYAEIKNPGDILRVGSDLLIASRYNKSRCIYAVAAGRRKRLASSAEAAAEAERGRSGVPARLEKEGPGKNEGKGEESGTEVRTYLRYPPWPTLPGEPSNTAGILRLEDGRLVCAEGNSESLDWYGPDLAYRESTPVPGTGLSRAEATASALLLYASQGRVQHLLSRKDGSIRKLQFKGVEAFWGAWELKPGLWLLSGEERYRLFQGSGEEAVELPLPAWMGAQEKVFFFDVVPLPEGGGWVLRYTPGLAEGKRELLRINAALEVTGTAPIAEKMWLSLLAPAPGGGIYASVGGVGLLRFDGQGRNPQVVLPDPGFGCVEFLPDGGLVHSRRDANGNYEVWLCTPLTTEGAK